MKIFDFEIIEGSPALFWNELKAVIVSDLHLGLEGTMAEEGAYFPKFQLDSIKEDFDEILSEKEAEKLIIAGDLKHQFKKTSGSEKKEIKEFLDFLKGYLEEIIVLRGNHDNFVGFALSEIDNVVLKEYLEFENVFLAHGHQEEIVSKFSDPDIIIIGHEHPALVLPDEVGFKEKFRSFLYGNTKDERNIIVLPSFSKISSGNRINNVGNSELLSPYLRDNVEVRELKPVVVHESSNPLEFPKLGKLNEVF